MNDNKMYSLNSLNENGVKQRIIKAIVSDLTKFIDRSKAEKQAEHASLYAKDC